MWSKLKKSEIIEDILAQRWNINKLTFPNFENFPKEETDEQIRVLRRATRRELIAIAERLDLVCDALLAKRKLDEKRCRLLQ